MKRKFTLNSTLNFEVDKGVIEEELTFKEAIDKGYMRVVNFSVTVMSEDGDLYEDTEFLDIVRDAIIYGLREKA